VAQSPWPSSARNWRLLILAEMLIPMLFPMVGARKWLRVTKMRVTLALPFALYDTLYFWVILFDFAKSPPPIGQADIQLEMTWP